MTSKTAMHVGLPTTDLGAAIDFYRRLWVDGELVSEHGGIAWRNLDELLLNHVIVENLVIKGLGHCFISV